MLQIIQNFVMTWLGLDSAISFLISFVALAFLVFVFCFLADFVAKTYLVKILNLLISKAYLKLSSFLKERQVVKKLAHIAPAIVLYIFAPAFRAEEMAFTVSFIFILQQASLAYIIFTLTRAFLSFLDVIEDVYNQYEVSKKRPIKSYLQIAKIVFTILGIVLFVSLLLDKSPLAFFTGIGAAATILVLIFKDSILSFLASVQLASYDMIRIDDWIEVPKYGANGDVIEISLTTVKVRNFDKTITTIPTSALVTEGVKNWRGMTESGGRRIKRSFRVDLTSVHFCNEALLENLKKHIFFKDFLNHKKELFEKDFSKLSNLKFFRHYLEFYLKNNKDIFSDGSFTFIVRELEPEEYGLPMELYVFVKTTDWVRYEAIQADVMDHVFSAIPFFDLRAYQRR